MDFLPTLGAFALEQHLSTGGMGEVWRARHLGSSAPVAVKLLTSKGARDPRVRARLHAEARAVAALQHPGVVVILDYGQVSPEVERRTLGHLAAGSPYLVMEYVGGGTLQDLSAPLSWFELRATLLALLDALAHSHARGVIHRDIKPSNVLINRDPAAGGPVKLADFGIAHQFDEAGDPFGGLAGTPHYMAPEQVRGEWRDHGPWTDLYGLGCVAWELACGAAPFADIPRGQVRSAHLKLGVPPLAPVVPVPDRFDAWIAQMVDPQPRRRFQRAADAAWALRDLGTVAAPRPNDFTLAPAGDESTSIITLSWSGALTAPRHLRTHPPVPDTWRALVPAPDSKVLAAAGLGLLGLRTPPFVGREAERDALWAALNEVVTTGSPRAALVRGAAGVGKSRLVDWIAERADELGAATVLRASHVPEEAPLEALRDALVRYLGGARLERDEALARLTAALPALGLADPFDVEEVAEVLFPEQTPRQARFETDALPTPYALLARLLGRMARSRPVILRVDDVHWGPGTLTLARRLLGDPDMGQVLLLMTARPDRVEPGTMVARMLERLTAMPGARVLDLPPLPRSSLGAMVDGLLPLARPLREELLDMVDGAPLYAIQLVGEWAQRGLLRPKGAVFTIPRSASYAVPRDLRALTRGRLEQLLEGASPVGRLHLERAAVLGLRVDEHEWAQACDDPEGIALATSGIIAFSPTAARERARLVEALLDQRLAVDGEDGWRFAHSLVREALWDMARDAGRWAEHNLACARLLARTHGQPGRRGVHLVRAGALEEALPLLFEGAEDLRLRVGAPRALEMLETAEQTMLDLDLEPADRRWGVLYVRRAALLSATGDDEEAWDEAERVRQSGAAHGWGREVAVALAIQGDLLARKGAFDAADKLLRRALRAARKAEAPLAEARVLHLLASQRHRRFGVHPDTRALAERSLAIRQAQGDSENVAHGLAFLAMMSVDEGDLVRARALAGRALPLFRQLRKRAGLALCDHVEAECARREGDEQAARDGYARALKHLEQSGSTQAEVMRLNLAVTELRRGDEPAARRLAEEALRRLTTLEWLTMLGLAHVFLAACAATRRDRAALTRALDALEKLPVVPDPDGLWAAGAAAEQARRAGWRSLAVRLDDLAEGLRPGAP
ncbi:MAG: protein kinase [Alphaproteobacteria bacterium]|nr:protein kinase [Alphaproteobacteria bacterium]